MRRTLTRVVCALAAVVVAMLVVVLPGAAPAQAGPADLCSVKEWENPGNWSSCTDRIHKNVNQMLGCGAPPSPDSPSSGVGSAAGGRPDADLNSGVSGQYTRYGVAGYQTTVFDLGCAAKVSHADAEFENTVANGIFFAAAGIIAAANGLRDLAYNPAKAWGWSDHLVKTLSDQGFGWLFSPFAALAIALVGVYLMWRARRGNMADTMHTAGWALGVLVAVILVANHPLGMTHAADQGGTTALAAIHDALDGGPATIPPDQCPLPGPDSCVDHRTVSDRASDTVTEAVLYKNWLRAEFGSDTSPTASKYGAALYDAGTLSWGQASYLKDHPDQQAQVFQEKADRWTAIAEQIKTEDPVAYDNLRGLHGWSRIWDSLAAAASALAFALFDVTASIIILLGFAVVRFAVIVLPVIGTVAIFRPASADLRRVFHATIGSLLNVVVFGTVAALFLRWVAAIYDSGLNTLMQLVAVLGAAVALLLWLRPVRRLTALAGHTASGVGEGNGGGKRFVRLRRMARATTAPPVTPPTSTEPPADTPKSPVVQPTRPEAHVPTPPAPRPAPPQPVSAHRPSPHPRPEALTGATT